MKTVNIHEAKTHLSRLLAEVAAGQEIVIANAGSATRPKRASSLLPSTPFQPPGGRSDARAMMPPAQAPADSTCSTSVKMAPAAGRTS